MKSGEPPMCKVTADCDAGELCDEGVCWGNPPADPLAALISPPSTRSDLASREALVVPITGDGWIDKSININTNDSTFEGSVMVYVNTTWSILII